MGSSEAPAQEYLTLNTGAKIPALGFGTFANEGEKGGSYKATLCALNAGYRHLDCAAYYMNEDEVGDAIRDFLKANPSVKRSDIFITTKVWNHLSRPGDIEWSLDQSLKRFGLDNVDMFLLHWPFVSKRTDDMTPVIGDNGLYVVEKNLNEEPEEAWASMEKLLETGKTKAIGTSNWSLEGLKKLLSVAKVPPACNQIEMHPFLSNPEQLEFLKKNNILPVAYSPLGSQGQVPGIDEKVSTNPTLNQVAEKKGCTLAQLLIGWGIQRGYAVLPKSSTPSRIESNFQRVHLTDEEMAAIGEVAKTRRIRYVNMGPGTFGHDPFAGVHSI
ncbi:putative glycerol dehydrogenase [Phaeomoniella chlamydospora]|uniref:D-xylose reductase [NAD(P)H] n=1 Tax=Phaeomoniella chlamydospora TaxID=158046 RepID=A0A0G2F1Z4_PHACM|nr:putative glycerol dehydrogenase [Phaeomoniella chlamydospora]